MSVQFGSSTPAGQIAKLGPALRQTGQVLRNSGGRLLQNTGALRSNALVFSSLALVISRIIVCNVSAVKAKGTEEGPYRYREAIRTTIREICGWTLGFAVLRQLQKLISLGIDKAFGVVEKGGPEKVEGMFSQLRKIARAVLNQTELPDIPPLKPGNALPREIVGFSSGRVQKVQSLLGKIPGIGQKIAESGEKELLIGIRNWAPILIGSIPTVLLAGYLLERFTRDHGDNVVNAISRVFGGNTVPSAQAEKPAATEKALAAPEAGNEAHARFGHFMRKVQAKQQERSRLSAQV